MMVFVVAFAIVLLVTVGRADAAIPKQQPWPSDGLVGHWDFSSGSADDQTGNWAGTTFSGSPFTGSALELRGSGTTSFEHASATGYTGPTIDAKTIVSRVKIINRDAANDGSIASIGKGTTFDAIVWEQFGQNSFYLSSESQARTDTTQSYQWTHNNVEVTVAVVMDISGVSTKTKIYIDGFLRSEYSKVNSATYSGGSVKFTWGPRHDNSGAVSADVYETRLYNRALRESEIVQMVPVQETSAGNYLRGQYIGGFPGFLNARRMCRGNGLNYAQIRTTAESNEAKSILRVQFFTSASDRASEGNWVWEDGPGAGITFYTKSGNNCIQSWCGWTGSEPNDAGGQDYMRVVDSTGRWDDASDAAGDIDWMCQRETAESESKHFKLYAARKRMNLDYGLAFCAGLGGHLATIATTEESEEVNAIIGSGLYLVAGSDAAVEGEWRWMAGEEKGDKISDGSTCRQELCGWHGGEPNNWSGEHELYVKKGTTVLLWHDDEGARDGYKGIVCEFRQKTETLEVTPSSSLVPTGSDSPTTSPTQSTSSSLEPTASGSLSRSVTPSVSKSNSIPATPSPTLTPTRIQSPSLTHLGTPSAAASTTVTSLITATLTSSRTRVATSTASLISSESISASTRKTSTISDAKSSSPTVSVTHRLTVSDSVPLTMSVSTPVTRTAATPTIDFFFSRFLVEPAMEAEGITAGATQRLQLGIEGETFDLGAVQRSSVTGSGPAKPAVPVFWCEEHNVFLAGGESAAKVSTIPDCFACVNYQNGHNAGNATDTAARLLRSNATLEVNASSTATLVVPGAQWFGTQENDLHFTLSIDPGCFARRRPFPALNFTIRKTPKKTGVPQEVIQASKDAATVAVVAGGLGSPAIAGQLSRSSIALTLSECSPDEDEGLERSQHPLQMKLGDSNSDFAFYVGGAMLNHLVCAGCGFLLIVMGFIHSRVKGTSLKEGFEFSRFPSLLSFPLMFLIEPTAMCAVTAMIYASLGWKIAAGISLGVCCVLPMVLLWYLRRNREHYVFHALWGGPESDGTPPGALEVFFFGRSKWTDINGPHTTGFCQRNRLLFCDYRGEYYWFLCVEMVMCVLCGSLDGVKLGVGQCNTIIIGLIIVFVLFLLLLLIVRPYNAPFLQWFAVALTFLQMCSTICVAIFVLGGHEPAEVYAQWFSLCCMYLLMGRMVYDVGPKSYRWYKGLLKLVGLRKKFEPELPPAAEPMLTMSSSQVLEKEVSDVSYDEEDAQNAFAAFATKPAIEEERAALEDPFGDSSEEDHQTAHEDSTTTVDQEIPPSLPLRHDSMSHVEVEPPATGGFWSPNDAPQRKYSKQKHAAATLTDFKRLATIETEKEPNGTLARLLNHCVSRSTLTQQMEQLRQPPNPVELAPKTDLEVMHALLIAKGSPDDDDAMLGLNVAESIAQQRPDIETKVPDGLLPQASGSLAISIAEDDAGPGDDGNCSPQKFNGDQKQRGSLSAPQGNDPSADDDDIL